MKFIIDTTSYVFGAICFAGFLWYYFKSKIDHESAEFYRAESKRHFEHYLDLLDRFLEYRNTEKEKDK